MNDVTPPTASTLARIKGILLWIGAIIVVLTDLIAALELHKIEELLRK
jgi:hypothetical protein